MALASPTLAASTQPDTTRILGLGHYQPANVVTNDDLIARGVKTDSDWIVSRLGIKSRRFADPDETVVDMAVAAGGKALANAGIDASAVDLVIVATCTMPTPVPTAAPRVAARLGILSPGAYDLNSGCAGFVYALSAASAAVQSGQAHYVLVVAAERFSGWLDFDDRSTCVILADGAGAAVVGPSHENGFGPIVWGSDGDMADTITIDEHSRFFRQDGQSVFRWATSHVAPVALEACRRAGVEVARSGRLRAAPGQSAHHRADGAQDRRSGHVRRRPGHRRIRQHVGGDHPARAVQIGRTRRGRVRGTGPDRRLRRRPGLCGAGPARALNRSYPSRPHSPPPITTGTTRSRHQVGRGTTRKERSVATTEEIRAGLAEILGEVADVAPGDVQDDKSFTDDLDVDSLSMVEVAMAAEEKFGVKIPDDELPKLKTVGDAVRYIESNG